MELRRVIGSDAIDFFLWWNDRETRRFSGVGGPVSLDKHLRWFGENIRNPHWYVGMIDGQYLDDVEGRHIYVNGRSIGAARVDADPIDHRAWISINLDPQERGKGYGTELIRLATDRYHTSNTQREYMFDTAEIGEMSRGTVRPVVFARIHRLNTPSLRAFAKAGYTSDSEDGVWLVYRKG